VAAVVDALPPWVNLVSAYTHAAAEDLFVVGSNSLGQSGLGATQYTSTFVQIPDRPAHSLQAAHPP